MNISTRLCIVNFKNGIRDYVVCIDIGWESYIPLSDFKYGDGSVRRYLSLEEYIDEVSEDWGYELLNIEYE